MTDWPVISAEPWVQAHYEKCRAEGTSHTLAEMFALAQAPQSRTDREFLLGHCNGSQFAGQDERGNFYKAVAESEGQNTTGKVYLSQLAAYPGDPRAWVGGRGDARRLCEERGWGCEGQVNVKLANLAEPTGGGLADDIVEREAAPLIAMGEKADEARQKVRDQLTPHWAK